MRPDNDLKFAMAGGGVEMIDVVQMLTSVGALLVACYVAWTARAIQRTQWLASQNANWSAFNALGGQQDNEPIGSNVHNLFRGRPFDAEQIEKYRAKTFIFQRINILEADFFRWNWRKAHTESLYNVVGDIKSISKRPENIEFFLDFVLQEEDYDPRFVAFCLAVMAHYFTLRQTDGELRQGVYSATGTLSSSQLKRIGNIINIAPRPIIHWASRERHAKVPYDTILCAIHSRIKDGHFPRPSERDLT